MTILYVPDVVWIRDREGAMSGVKLHVGDGATITRSMVRRIEGTLIGPHAGANAVDLVSEDRRASSDLYALRRRNCPG